MTSLTDAYDRLEAARARVQVACAAAKAEIVDALAAGETPPDDDMRSNEVKDALDAFMAALHHVEALGGSR